MKATSTTNRRKRQRADLDARARTYHRLNLENVGTDTHIYRIISMDRLFELFEKRQNVLVSPASWDDPFENFILRSNWRLPSGETGTFEFQKDFYGQCWTLLKASDAMWRIYSPKSDGVRIRTSIDRLASSLAQGLGQWSRIQCHIGKVEYLNEARMIAFAQSVLAGGLSEDMLARTLLVKRPAFQHEREVRLLYFEKENHRRGEKLYRYDVDPHWLVDQMMLDPRLEGDEALALKEKVIRRTGFKGPVKRSLLYAPPKRMFIPIG